jgi:hypothetical protein
MEDYINLKDIPINTTNTTNTDETFSVYQIQSINDNNYIMEVGKCNNMVDIIINEFNINSKIKCIIVSTIIDKEGLINSSTTCKFNMIKIIINNKSYMILNFNFSDHIKNNKTIIDYISNKTNSIKLKGFFSISFHYNNKYINLENFETFNNINDVITKMINYLFEKQIYDIITSF